MRWSSRSRGSSRIASGRRGCSGRSAERSGTRSRRSCPWSAQPTLIIWGANDRVISDVPGSIRAANQILRVRQVVIPRCGHAPQIEKSRLVNELVLRFFRDKLKNIPPALDPGRFLAKQEERSRLRQASEKPLMRFRLRLPRWTLDERFLPLSRQVLQARNGHRQPGPEQPLAVADDGPQRPLAARPRGRRARRGDRPDHAGPGRAGAAGVPGRGPRTRPRLRPAAPPAVRPPGQFRRRRGATSAT